ncbi:glycoside hydrolase family 10 protein [Saccharicrinis sp. GN24d3]|uniref:glycoside hydrolase family 10 protein n=1 Tax=Saccharicrinis sp. GN24d3 TaxID=3458416 RepID=UPI0040372D64
MKKYILLLLLCLGFKAQAKDYPKREMRAVWIASVANIDWPSKSGLSVEMQKDEMIELLDLAKAYKMNTVVFQIRPASDAFYPSALEPWSQWLIGEQGQAPEPFYDPLQFTIEECKMRGLDIQVWLNPYRAVFDTARSSISENHPTRLHPEWFVSYGKKSYFNPGLPETRNHVASVVADIVRRYAVDGIHFDDYFYPYRIAGKDFQDQEAFEMYPRGFEPGDKEDWRRDNVDLIIKQLHDTIEKINPHIEFGISPFGVWRNQSKDPRGSATSAGQTNYDDLYADVLKWDKEGWIDYVTPQIYWHIGKEVADYAIIADWWSKNAFGCRLYTGQGLYRIDKKSKDKAWHSSKEIIRQIKLNRSIPNIDGSMFFSAKYLKRNPLNLKEKMAKHMYRYEALPPVNMRVEQIPAQAPKNARIEVVGNTINLNWESGENNDYFVIYKFKKGKPANTESSENIVRITGANSVNGTVNKFTDPDRYYYVVTGISKTNMESTCIFFK